MPISAARTVQNCTLGKQNNLSINEWHNIRGPTPQTKTRVSTQIRRRNHSFEENNVNILARETETGVKKNHLLERLSLNRGVGLQHNVSLTYNAVLSSLPRQLNNYLHMGPASPSNPRHGWWLWNSELTHVLNNSVRTLPHRVWKPATPLQLVRTKAASLMKVFMCAGKGVFSILAFDTIDHVTWIDRSMNWVDISGTSLKWFTHIYLTDTSMFTLTPMCLPLLPS